MGESQHRPLGLDQGHLQHFLFEEHTLEYYWALMDMGYLILGLPDDHEYITAHRELTSNQMFQVIKLYGAIEGHPKMKLGHPNGFQAGPESTIKLHE